MRMVCLDIETTGLDCRVHRVIEIGCVEIIDRRVGRQWHTYVRPKVRISPEATAIHGITESMVANAPDYADVKDSLFEFLDCAERVLIHNAPFDVGFLDVEHADLGLPPFGQMFRIVDTLKMARKRRIGARSSSLDALMQEYRVRGRQDGLHGAVEDARILAEVVLAMTVGQETLDLALPPAFFGPVGDFRPTVPVISSSEQERAAHAEVCSRLGIKVF